MSGQTLLAVVSAIVSLVVGYFGWSNSRQVNKNKASEIQQAFTQQVMTDVAEAKKEAAEARTDAAAARRDNEAAEERQKHLRREMNAIQDWVDAVVRARDRYIREFEASGKELVDTGVIRLLRAINGGPHIGPE